MKRPTKRQRAAALKGAEHIREALDSIARAGDVAMDLADDDCIEFHQGAGQVRRVLEVLERWLARKGGKAP